MHIINLIFDHYTILINLDQVNRIDLNEQGIVFSKGVEDILNLPFKNDCFKTWYETLKYIYTCPDSYFEITEDGCILESSEHSKLIYG